METTWKPTTAGILEIISGVMGIGVGIVVMGVGRFVGTLGGLDWSDFMGEWGGAWGPGMGDMPSKITEIVGISSTIMLVVGIVVLAFGIIALVGGIYSIKRRKWGLALAGDILTLPIGGILALLALIFVALGRKEFE